MLKLYHLGTWCLLPALQDIPLAIFFKVGLCVRVHVRVRQGKGVSSPCEGISQYYSIVILCYILFLYGNSKLRTGLGGGELQSSPLERDVYSAFIAH